MKDLPRTYVVYLLQPYEAEGMEMWEANPAVNNVRNNGPEMLESLERRLHQ